MTVSEGDGGGLAAVPAVPGDNDGEGLAAVLPMDGSQVTQSDQLDDADPRPLW